MGGIPFDPAKDIPSLQGKVILITGGNIGIGKQSALELSKHNPSQLWIGGRNGETGNAAVEEIKAASPGASVRFLKMDLASFDSVKQAVKTFQASASRLDILMCSKYPLEKAVHHQSMDLFCLTSRTSLTTCRCRHPWWSCRCH